MSSSVINHDVQQPGARILDNPALEDFMIQDFMEFIRYDRDYLMTLSESSFAVTTRVLEMFALEYTSEDEAIIPTGVVPADDSFVSSLEIKKADEELANSDEVCSVCLEGWKMGDDVKYSPCKHCFHPSCVDKWFNINHFCPLCRFELPPAKDV